MFRSMCDTFSAPRWKHYEMDVIQKDGGGFCNTYFGDLAVIGGQEELDILSSVLESQGFQGTAWVGNNHTTDDFWRDPPVGLGNVSLS